MKVNIGPFVNWVGPYQIADTLQKFGLSEDRAFAVGGWLSKTFVGTLCEWIHSKKNRKVEVKIEPFDTWNMDGTLAYIILPMLRAIAKDKHGAPGVDDDDVPSGLNLRAAEAPPKENEWDIDVNHFKRWDWALAEMIWTFEQLHPDSDWESQYHSGVIDIVWQKTDGTTLNPTTGKRESLSEMLHGPKNTHKFDIVGYTAHEARISNGLRLFGKYYRALWT